MENLGKVRKIADYQLGKGVGQALFPENAKITFSRTTGRIRHIYLKGRLLATLRPTDGMFSLTINGARRLVREACSTGLLVKVSKDSEPFIAKGKSVFAKHAFEVNPEIRPQEEVTVVGEDNKVLAVGKAVLTGREMGLFKRGIAIRVRRGVAEE
jgi:predicted RNA-binding protein (TIGR00451 family)